MQHIARTTVTQTKLYILGEGKSPATVWLTINGNDTAAYFGVRATLFSESLLEWSFSATFLGKLCIYFYLLPSFDRLKIFFYHLAKCFQLLYVAVIKNEPPATKN